MMGPILLFAALTLSQHGSAVELLSPERVQQSVLKNFPLIEEAERKREAARERELATRGEFDTKLKFKAANRIDSKYEYQHLETSIEKTLPIQGLTVFAGHRQGLGNVPAYTGKYGTSSTGEVFAGLSVPVLRNRGVDSARLDRSLARIDVEVADTEVRLKRNAYVFKALSTYQKWKLTHQKWRIYRDLLKLAEERQVMLDKRVQAGDVERIKLTDNQRSINKRKDELLELEQELEGLNAYLGLYVRDPAGEPIDVATYRPEESVPRPSDVEFGVDVSHNPQLQVLDRQLEQVMQEEDFGRNQMLPQVNLDAQAIRDVGDSADYDRHRWQVGVSVEIPLENRKGSGKRSAARAKRLALEQQRRYVRNELVNVLKRAARQIHLASERTKLITQELENARLLAQAERKRWMRGDSDLYIVALREQDTADVEAKLWTAYYEFEQLQLDARLSLASFVP